MNLLSFKSVIKHFVRKLYRPHFIPANFMQTFGIDSQSQIQYFVYSSNWKHFMKKKSKSLSIFLGFSSIKNWNVS